MDNRKCVICGEWRAVEEAHLAFGPEYHRSEDRKRIEPTVIFCPSHHYLYDYKKLRQDEIDKLPALFKKYYLAPKKKRASIVRKIIKRELQDAWKIVRKKRNGEPIDFYNAINRFTKEKIPLGTADEIYRMVKGYKQEVPT